jgi:hypothetical protein
VTHYELLLQELALSGRVTYSSLAEKYAARGYTRNGFRVAAFRAQRQGKLGDVVAGSTRGSLVRRGYCPCCGRALREEER